MNLIILIPPAVIIIGILFFYSIYKRSNVLRGIEQGKVSKLNEFCGIRYSDPYWGGFNITKPLARCSLYEDFLILAYGNKELILKTENIIKFEVKKYVISHGIELTHQEPRLPRKIIIWFKDKSLIEDYLSKININY